MAMHSVASRTDVGGGAGSAARTGTGTEPGLATTVGLVSPILSARLGAALSEQLIDERRLGRIARDHAADRLGGREAALVVGAVAVGGLRHGIHASTAARAAGSEIGFIGGLPSGSGAWCLPMKSRAAKTRPPVVRGWFGGLARGGQVGIESRWAPPTGSVSDFGVSAPLGSRSASSGCAAAGGDLRGTDAAAAMPTGIASMVRGVVPSTRRFGIRCHAARAQRNALRCQSVSSHSDPAAVAVVFPLTQPAFAGAASYRGSSDHRLNFYRELAVVSGRSASRGLDDLNAGLWPRGLDGFQLAPVGADSASRPVAAAA
jgi:hypothetical protein